MVHDAGGSSIGPLAALPLFFRLQGRKVLIAGEGAGLPWKLRLFASTGAEIYYAGEPTGEARTWLEADNPVCCWNRRAWRRVDFEGMALAIGAFDALDEAARFSHTARAIGIPVNLIDRPELSDFQFGAIVQRGPVSVGISTDGAAPILAQALRRRIETILPPALGDWAEAARKARARLKEILPDAATRRQFWDGFVGKAMTRPADEIEAALDEAGHTPAATGRVSLVGAGPGNADGLTLTAMRTLQSADIVLADDLIGDEVLRLARREAQRMRVGKRAGRASCRQDDINAMMLDFARQGLHVVRLKSGDPSIFARTGQETAFLRAAGIEVEHVPGVSMALAAAAELGVPLTDRDCARAVKFVTAHSREDDLPDIDWQSCAAPDTTLMVYMGGRTAAKLSAALIARGLPGSTPVVVACAIAGERQRFIPTRLAALPHTQLPLDDPILIGIGSVFAPICEAASQEAGESVTTNAKNDRSTGSGGTVSDRGPHRPPA